MHELTKFYLEEMKEAATINRINHILSVAATNINLIGETEFNYIYFAGNDRTQEIYRR